MNRKILCASFLTPVLCSVFVHFALSAGVAYLFLHPTALIKGGLGKAGRPDTMIGLNIVVVENPEPFKPLPVRTKSFAREGMAIPAARLPSEIKNQNPKLIDTPPHHEISGGVRGNLGSGENEFEAIGNSERSNAFGLYLQKIQQKIQANLQSPGEIAFSYRVLLKLKILTSGKIDSITIEKSSGDNRLDRLAVAAAKKSDPFDPYEKEFAVIVPVHFRSL